MQVSIDAILGSAKKINAHKETAQGALADRGKSEAKGDTLSIESRIDSRLDSLENEFKEIQTSLTENQIIMSGVNALMDDLSTGGKNTEAILNDTLFNGRRILFDEVGATPSSSDIKAAAERTAGKIDADISGIKKLQVELDNITASDLASSDRADTIISRVESSFADFAGSLERISRVNPDSVMRLTR